MESLAPPFLESITRDRAAILSQAWRDCEGIPPRAGLMRIAQQTSLDFRIVRYWFYCRSNYEGIARAFDALGPKKKLEFPKLEEYYLFDKFTDDLDAPDTASKTPQALGPSHGASTTSNQQNQPAHAQAESSSSTATQGRARRASTTTKKKQQKPSTTTTKKRQQQRPTQEPNENAKRRQDPASEDWEVKAASKARTKRTKVATASAAPPPPPSSETLPEAAPIGSRTAETDVTAAPAPGPSDDPFSQNTATEAGSILSLTTATPSDMDSTPSLSATTTQDTVAPTSSLSEGAADVNMEDMTTVANCNPSSTATAATHSKARQPKMFMSAVVIPPYKGSSSGSSSPTSNRRHITTLHLPPSVMQSISAVSTPGAESLDASTPASTPKLRFKLIRNRMEPYKHSRRNSNSEEATNPNPSTNTSGANLAVEQELVLQSEKLTATDASVQKARAKAKAKVVTGPKRRAQSAKATSEGEPNTASIDIQLKKRSKSAPLSASKDGEPGSHNTPESEDSREQTLNDSDQNGGVLVESRSHVQKTADTALVPVEKETLNAIAGKEMVREAEDKEVDAMEDQEEGHLGTVRSSPSISSKANSSLQSATLTVTSRRDGGDTVQGEKQDKRLPEQQRSARLSRSRSRGPSTAPSRAASQAPSRPRMSLPDSGTHIEPTQVMTAQHDVVDAPEGEGNEPAAASKGQQDKGTSAQLLWEQPWTKQYASIKPMKRRSTMVENGIAPSPSKASQSASITNASNPGNNTMAPDERMATEKKIVSMDQTPPTPKSTDDTDRQARTPQNKELGKFKNTDCRQLEDEGNPKAASITVFADGSPYMKAQTNEMDAGGSSYSPDATYDCLSPTDPYHSDDSWSEGSDVENDILTASATRGRHRKNASPADDRDVSDRSRRGDHRPEYSSRSHRSREHGDHSRERGHRRRSHRSSDRIRGRSRDRSGSHSSRARRSVDRSEDRSINRLGKTHRSRDRSRERSRDYSSKSHHSKDRSRDRSGGHSSRRYHSSDRSRDRSEGHSSRPCYSNDRSRDRSGGHSSRPRHSNDRSRDRFEDSTNKTHRSRARSREHSEERSRGHSSRSHRYDEACIILPQRYY